MSSHTFEDLTSCILDYQANIVRVAYRKKVTLVDPEHDAEALAIIWDSANLTVDDDGEGEGGVVKWRKLGFDSEDLVHEFAEYGILGLDCLVRMAPLRSDWYTHLHHFRKTLFNQTQTTTQRYARQLGILEFKS